jgi:hypothetical protein
MAVNGLELITPTSIVVTGAGSSATINAGGSVTFATAATLSLNGVFTSAYDNYVIDMRHVGSSGTATTIDMRFRASGTDASGSNYTRQFIFAGGTTISGDRATSTLARIGSIVSTQRSGHTLFAYGPALAQPTAARAVSVEGTDNARILDCAFTHSVSTAYDGFTLIPVSGSFTGLIKVYGLAQ